MAVKVLMLPLESKHQDVKWDAAAVFHLHQEMRGGDTEQNPLSYKQSL